MTNGELHSIVGHAAVPCPSDSRRTCGQTTEARTSHDETKAPLSAEQQRRRRRAEEAEASRRRRARDADARSRAPPRSAADGTAAWRERYDEYERRWAAWEADEAAGPGELPCPLSLELAGWHLCGLPPGAPRAEKRRAVKRALLRWHPDKLLQRFGARFAGDGGDAALELAAATARELNTLNAEVG